jgi:malate dehydrogenase (oxaloacetate-decarboxylating)
MNKKFPGLMIHFEDFGRDNARRILNQYEKTFCTFNGDIQGTGVVALACVLAGANASGRPLTEHKIVILGAGTAGVGIADQIMAALIQQGLSEKEARARLWLIDKSGLLTTESALLSFQAAYARLHAETANWQVADRNKINLLEVVQAVHPSILIGCSTVTGAFNETVIKTMAAHVERPIIMPLSNPTSLSEAVPEDLIQWTEGKAIIATGSPFAPVFYQGKTIDIAQSNNALAFPGVGLGVVAVKAKRISEEMLWAATLALSACSPIEHDKLAPLLPKLANAKMVSFKVAVAVAEVARRQGLTEVADEVDISDLVRRVMWDPKYYPLHLIF